MPVMHTRRGEAAATAAGGGPPPRSGSRSTTAALLPPNAKEFDTTTPVGRSAATSGMMSSPLGERVTPAVLAVGGWTPSRTASAQTTASIAPAAPRVWPIIDLVELTGGGGSNSSRIAFGSTQSLVGVPVPCPLM